MFRTLLIVLMLGITSFCFAQEINQTDSQGRKQGPWIKKYPDGTTMYEGNFKDGKPYGTMKRYFETGELKAEMEFTEDGTRAYTKMFYQNGDLAAEGELVRGEKEGHWKYYSFYDKSLTAEENYKNGIKQGVEKKYYSDGQLAELITWENDKKHGPWKQYYENGQVKSESTFTNGEINGEYTVYRENGMPEVKGTYNMGRMDGTWFYYDENGQVARDLAFENGKPLDEEKLTEEELEFFDLIEKNKGKFDEPSIEDFVMPGNRQN